MNGISDINRVICLLPLSPCPFLPFHPLSWDAGRRRPSLDARNKPLGSRLPRLRTVSKFLVISKLPNLRHLLIVTQNKQKHLIQQDVLTTGCSDITTGDQVLSSEELVVQHTLHLSIFHCPKTQVNTTLSSSIYSSTASMFSDHSTMIKLSVQR